VLGLVAREARQIPAYCLRIPTLSSNWTTFYLPTASSVLEQENLDCCLRDKLLVDLKDEVNKWQDTGEQVIILTDMNKKVMAPVLQKFCQDLHLVEAISTMHGRSPTPTHQRGSRAIDRIYMSRTLLKDAQGGFLSFGEVMHSNHHAVWIDICTKHVGMVHCPPGNSHMTGGPPS